MTEWSAYRHYKCVNCTTPCINELGTSFVDLQLCRSCFSDLPETVSVAAASERASGGTPSHGGPTERVSARPRAERRGNPNAKARPKARNVG